jgi:3-carboxy-cis,cis-muconate cycloisomerase
MSVSVFEHPFLGGLLGDPAISACFSVEADLAAMLRFESALARAEAAAGLFSVECANAIEAGCASFVPDMTRLAHATARDGVVVPELVRQLRTHIGADACVHLHFGATSQDVVDTSLVLRLRKVCEHLAGRLTRVEAGLCDLDKRFGAGELMGRTRMQQAVPISAGHRIGNWLAPLSRQAKRLADARDDALQLQFGGAVGTLHGLGDNADAVSRRLGEILVLPVPSRCWHTDRSALAALAHSMVSICGSLGKMGQDLALMAQTEVGEIVLGGTGSSSAMAHKRNPVKAEILVTLARYSATLMPAMDHAMVHENERSGSAWTLEWMVLPQIAMACGTSLRTAAELIESIESIGAEVTPSSLD